MHQAKLGELSKEQISALADGSLNPTEAQAAIDLLLGSVEARAFWYELHAVGDCLRSDDTGAALGQDGFMERFALRLDAEPVVLAPRAQSAVAAPVRPALMRYGLPGASIAAAIAMVLWMAVPQMTKPDAQLAEVTVAPQPTKPAVVEAAVATASAPAITRMDPDQVGEYLTAHQGSVQAASLTIVSDKAR
jgi:negative regulator of sigma E activity